MSGLQSVGNTIKTGIAKASDLRPVKWVSKKFTQNPESALATATVTSIILKDGIGCAMYVGQSLHNDKIPEKKRKFVAALDLTNGVLMIGAQIAMFFAMRKYSGKVFDKLFKKSFNPTTKSETVTRMILEDIKANGHGMKKQHYEQDFEKAKSASNDLFKFILDISAATIIGKRVIVPLIATPLAKKVEKKMEKHHADAPANEAQKADEKKQGEAKVADKSADKPVEEVGKKLDVVSTDSTNLLDKAKANQAK